jgi:hypothetical protein
VGTSICDSAERTRSRPSTIVRFGENAARMRQMLDGMWVKTIVLTRPTLSEPGRDRIRESGENIGPEKERACGGKRQLETFEQPERERGRRDQEALWLHSVDEDKKAVDHAPQLAQGDNRDRSAKRRRPRRDNKRERNARMTAHELAQGASSLGQRRRPTFASRRRMPSRGTLSSPGRPLPKLVRARGMG